MIPSSGLPDVMSKVKLILDKRNYAEAIRILDAIDDSLKKNSEILRLRAKTQFLLTDLRGSLTTIEAVLNGESPSIEDYYFAGERALELHCYDRAEEYFTKVIECELDSREYYFLSSSIIERAYARVKSDDFDGARSDIELLSILEESEETVVFWLSGVETLTKEGLLRFIEGTVSRRGPADGIS